jgi:hypothetical protein
MSSSKFIILQGKDKKDVKFPVFEGINYELSEVMKSLCIEQYDEQDSASPVVINQLTSDQLMLFKSFCENCEYTSETLTDSDKSLFLYNIEDLLNSLFTKYPKLKQFYKEELVNIDCINKYFPVADYLGVKLLEQLLICKVNDISKLELDSNESNMKYSKILKQKYLQYCSVDELSQEELNKLIES